MSELNLFEKFEGADLDRLIECLKAIKDADLKVDKYCQAGVNQNSAMSGYGQKIGRYCSIGFDVQWSYSCGECGEEYDFETYHDLEEYADKCNAHDQKCEACGDWEE